MENKKENFNMENKPEKKRRKKLSKVKIALIVIAVLLAIVIIIGILYSKTVVNAYYSAMSGKDNLEFAQEHIEKQNFSAANLALKQSQKNFEESKENIDKMFFVKYIPFIGRQYKAVGSLLNAAVLVDKSLISVSETVVEAVNPIISGDTTFNDLDTAEKREILKALQQSTPSFQLAISNIELAQIEMEKIPDTLVLQQIVEAKDLVNENLPTLKEILEGAKVVTKFLPELAGYPTSTNYLMLFHNNDELRPGGGFIGSYGVIKVKDAELTDIKTDDTYNLDDKFEGTIEMPWQIQTLLSPGIRTWYFRDSAWTPDFPTNAEKADWFYHTEGGTGDFNGIIALTPEFIEKLMEITGPISVPGQPKEFNSENFTTLLQYYVERRFVEIGIPEEYRKSIIGEIADVLIDRIFKLDREKWDDLLISIGQSMEQKHFLLYFKNDEIQDYIQNEGWGGNIKSVTDDTDYLMVVDSNMASRKTDQFMERSWHYNVDFTKEYPQVKLDLNYTNTSLGFSWLTTRYRSWTRVYVPLGSKIIKVTGNEKDPKYYTDLNTDYEVTEEFGKQTFGTFLNVEPGESKKVTFEYELPWKSSDYLNNDEYNILVQKQIGTIKPGVKIIATLPEAYPYTDYKGEGEVEKINGSVELTSDLLTDREFKFELN